MQTIPKKRKLHTIIFTSACCIIIVLCLILFLPISSKDRTESMPDNEDAPQVNEGSFSTQMEEEFVGSQKSSDYHINKELDGNIIKYNDEYIYYLLDKELYVYSIAGEDSKAVGTHLIEQMDDYFLSHDEENREMFLSKDEQTLFIIMPAYHNSRHNQFISLIALDISDPSNIKEINRLYFSGIYQTARICEESIILISRQFVYNNVPKYGTADNIQHIAKDDAIVPEDDGYNYCTTLYLIDTSSLEVTSIKALFDYQSDVYISDNTIYTFRLMNSETNNNGVIHTEAMSEIRAFSYSDNKLIPKGDITLAGYIDNQDSLDEHQGILRVVTQKSIWKSTEEETDSSVALYCIDLSTWKVISSINKFAPGTLFIDFVRFNENSAYIGTKKEGDTPAFFLDFSDLSNITYQNIGSNSGHIPSLLQFGDYLLGMNYDYSENIINISMYNKKNPLTIPVATYEIEDCYLSYIYNSYFIDSENMRIGFGIEYLHDDSSKYILLEFDGQSLHEIFEIPVKGNAMQKRAIYIDGYMYLFGDEFIVKKI